MKTLSLEFLEQNNACEEGIEFIKNNNLLNFPFELLDQVKGDHNGYITWLKECIGSGYEYDQNNNLIYYKNSKGHEEWKSYDENNNLIHYKNSKGYEEWNEYDKNSNLIHYTDSKGFKCSNEIEYYEDGQLKKYNELELPHFEKVTT